MKNYIIVFIIVMIFIFPHLGSLFSIRPSLEVNEFEIYAAEAHIAYLYADNTDTPKPEPKPEPEPVNPPEPTTCTCNGTKVIKTGDGRTFSCPCENCQCKKTGEAEPTEVVIEIPKQRYYMVVVTDPSWCTPCKMFEENVLPKLREWKWVISSNPKDNPNILLVDDDDAHTSWNITSLPAILVIDRQTDKAVRRLIGYHTAEQVEKLYYGNLPIPKH